ncbi:MAG: squalene/phytoene synthase family protein [Gammaproteobacteria bacterium]
MNGSQTDGAEHALYELLPATGSDLHYALLYAPRDAQHALRLIESFRTLIAAIPLQCSSPELTAVKLAWWHDEVSLLGTPRARHALTRTLGPLAERYTDLAKGCSELVEGITALLSLGRFTSVNERRQALAAAHGRLWEVHVGACGEERGVARDAAVELGIVLEHVYVLRNLRRHVEAGLAWVCRDREPAGAGDCPDADWYAALGALEGPALAADLAATRRELALHARHPRRLQSVFALAAMAAACLDEIRADGYRVWEHRIELTPLRKLWLAWKTTWTARSVI